MSNYDLTTTFPAYRIIKFFTERNYAHPEQKIDWGLQMNNRRLWTVGWGHVLINPLTGQPFKGWGQLRRMRSIIPNRLEPKMYEVQEFLKADVKEAERLIKLHIRKPLKQHEFDALAAFTTDMGYHKALYGALNTGRNVKEIWLATGISLGPNPPRQGAVLRRLAEYELFSTGTVHLKDILT